MQLPGQAVGEGLTKDSAEAFGLKEGTPVAASLIDAHAGGVGMSSSFDAHVRGISTSYLLDVGTVVANLFILCN